MDDMICNIYFSCAFYNKM